MNIVDPDIYINILTRIPFRYHVNEMNVTCIYDCKIHKGN